MISALFLTEEIRQQIARAAQAAFPAECCGLLEGAIDGDLARIAAVHGAKNLAQDDDRFEIDLAEHFRALRIARANGREIVGCYHSHPNGRAEPSARDGEGASETGFVWLIAAVVGPDVLLSAFGRSADGWQRLDMAEIAAETA